MTTSVLSGLQSEVTQPQSNAISIKELRVDYGDFTAVKELTIDIAAGEIFGLVGPNGAGKTSTFKVLTTLLQPTYGDISVCGVDIFEDIREARRIIGYMPDLAPVPSDLYAWEFLDYYAHAYGHYLTGKARKAAVEEVLEEVQLTDQRKSKCTELSRGQTQRLVLGKTILQKPSVLVLDEPASGLDPLSRRNLKMILRRIAERGATVVVSSHILSELAELSTSLGIMNKGELLIQGTADYIQDSLGSAEKTLSIRFLGEVDRAAQWLEKHEKVGRINILENRLECDFDGSSEEQGELVASLVGNGFRFRTLEEKQNSFEEILTRIAEDNL